MKTKTSVIWSLLLLIAVASLYRIIPNRPYGFAPQWAMALFAGAMVKDKKWALITPVLSMFLSDLIYQVLYVYHLSPIAGFYTGQWLNYLLFASVTFFGFLIKTPRVQNVLLLSIAAPTYFFLVSNFLTWAGVGDFVGYPKTASGLFSCYVAGLPFYKTSVIATVLFSGLLFGAHYLLGRRANKTALA